MKKLLLTWGILLAALSVFAQSPSGCTAGYINYADQANTLRHLFTAQASGGVAPYSYSWDFGDGATASSANPDHMFAATGFYNVCLTITDAANCTASYCENMFVHAASICAVSYTAVNSVPNSSTYTFTATVPAGNFIFSWGLGDGTHITTSTPTLTHTYAYQGSYHTVLSIYDTITHCTAYASQPVTVTTGATYCSVYFGHHPSYTNYLQHTFLAYPSSYSSTGTYLWTFGDGTSSTSSMPTHTYAQAGFYNVCVTFTDLSNCTSSFCYDLPIFNFNCFIDYTFTNNAATPMTYDFTAPYSSPTAVYIWNYGDGTVDTTTTPTTTHTYSQAGGYHSSLTVYDVGTGCFSSDFEIINVGSSGGNCYNYFYTVPDTIDFLTQTFFGVTADGSAGTNYLWDFGDGNTSTAATPTYTYAQAGLYTICLTLTDASGCVSVSCQPVHLFNWGCTTSFTATPDSSNLSYTFQITNPSPTATYIWDLGNGVLDTATTVTSTYTAGQPQYICLQTEDLVTGCIAYDCQVIYPGTTANCGVLFYSYPDHYNILTNYFYGYTYSGEMLASYLWDFGDGTTSTDPFATHTYAQTGHYYVCLTATDINGCVSSYCEHLYIYNPNNICAPTLSVTTTPAPALSHNFSATTSLASPVYFWDFGDGNTTSSTNNTTSHTYQSEGVYHVCLYAYQSTTGCYASYCDSVTVVFTPIPCQTAIQFAPDALDGNTYNFASTQTGVAPFNYAWDFGDGNTSTSATPSNTYVTSGGGMSYFNVSLTVTDADGCVATDSTTVSVFSYGDVISGVVAKEATLQFFGDAIVYLIQYDSTSGTLTAVDTTFTTQGFYQFSNVAAGSYLVKAALLTTDTDYTDYLPTYYGQSLAWTNATFVSPAPVDSGFVYNIVLIKGTNTGGAGFIGGMVVNGAGRPIIGNQTLIENIGELDAMPNVSVLLLDYNDNAVTHTVTAADGSYSFDKLDMGHYRVHVEEVGKMTFPANILIDPAGMHHTEVHFTIHSNMVTLTMVNRVMANIEQLNIFPNPVQDNLNVSLELKESMDLTINVTNLLGQQLISENRSLQDGAQNFELDLQNLPSGLYLLSLTSGTDIVTHKIYKQ